MNHPLAPDLSNLSDEDLEKQMQKLTSRFYTARGMNVPENVMYQLDLMLLTYEAERDRRKDVPPEQGGLVLETDPLPQEKLDDTDSTPKKFSALQGIQRRT